MIGVVDRVREGIISSKEAIVRMIAQMQKKELDQKIDEMLKDARKIKRVTIKVLGIGKSLGGKLGGIGRIGRSMLGGLSRLL